jgi:integrase
MSTPVPTCPPETPADLDEIIPMKPIDPKTLDTAFVRPNTPMFSDVIRHLEENPELFATRTRDMTSGLRRVARALSRAPEEVPADARWLQPRLQKVEPAALGLTPKSWSNALSDARAGLSRYGVLDRRFHRKSDLDPTWRRLWALALASGNSTLQPALGRFVYFLNQQNVAPTEVTDAHAVDDRDALAANEISKSPDVAYRAAVNGWNLAVRLLPDWPRVELALPRRQKLVKLPDATFPQSLLADLDRLAEKLTHPNPLDADGRLKPVRAATVSQYHRQILRFASELVRAGVPAERIVDIATICAPDMVERGLRQMLARNDNRTSRGISETAALLRNLSRSYCRVSEEALKSVAKLAARVAVKAQTGMTGKNRDPLRMLQDPSKLQRLLHLPDRLFASAKTGRKPYYRALDREVAVAIAILLVCPIRPKNLSAIHLERNLQRPGDGRVYLVFEDEEVKNERRLEFELPRDVVRMIDSHLASRVPELCPRGSPWLFPRRDGQGPVGANQFSVRITRIIRRATGLVVNAHLFRHLAVMIWLDASGKLRSRPPPVGPFGPEPYAEPLLGPGGPRCDARLLSARRGEEGSPVVSLVLSMSAWPEPDRAMWRSLVQPGGPLDDQGALAHLRSTSLVTLEVRYGRWLAWLVGNDPAALREPPSERATMARLSAWLEALAHVTPMSRLMFVNGTLRVLRAAARELDWQAQRRLEAHLKSAAGRGSPERKRGRILSSDVLLKAGLRHAGPNAEMATTPLEAAKRRRDGAMVAMLALMPMRRRAFANLELGRSLHILPEEIIVALPEELTKTGVPWEAPVPEQVAPALRRYLDEVRPWLMARSGARHDHLWVDDRGRPYDENFFGVRMGRLTARLTGVRVPPHFFRDAAATTLARMSPQAARLIRPILAHSGFRTAERHYIHAQGIEAGRDYAAVIARLKRERG